MGFTIVISSFFACVSQARKAFILSMVRGIVAVIPDLWLLSLSFGMDGIRSAMPVAEVITVILSLTFLINYKKYCDLNFNY